MLTLNMDVPEPWLVEPVRADYDLDNLRLEVRGMLGWFHWLVLRALPAWNRSVDAAHVLMLTCRLPYFLRERPVSQAEGLHGCKECLQFNVCTTTW